MRNLWVLIPAHNEEECIVRTMRSLWEQTLRPECVVVAADNCTDGTVALARHHGANVLVTQGNTDLKAGALNQGLDYMLPLLNDDDVVLIMDADSVLNPRWLETAVSELDQHPWTGAVCATFGGEERAGLIHALQRAEYARFARSISRHNARAQVLSGVATAFPVRTLRKVAAGRADGTLPPAPGIYDVTAATEDIELTFAVRRLGYEPAAPLGCEAYTDTMSTWRALATQRIRWQRGMLDALRLYGLNRQTLPSATRLAAVYLGSLIVPLYLTTLAVVLATTHHVTYNPVWLVVLPLFAFERLWTVRRLTWRERLLAVALVPEWLYDNFRSAVYWVALTRWLQRTERVWIST